MARFQAGFGGVNLTVELYFDKKPSFHTKLTIAGPGRQAIAYHCVVTVQRHIRFELLNWCRFLFAMPDNNINLRSVRLHLVIVRIKATII